MENNVPGKILYFQLFFSPMFKLHERVTQFNNTVDYFSFHNPFFSKYASSAVAFLAQMVCGRHGNPGRICDNDRALEV